MVSFCSGLHFLPPLVYIRLRHLSPLCSPLARAILDSDALFVFLAAGRLYWAAIEVHIIKRHLNFLVRLDAT